MWLWWVAACGDEPKHWDETNCVEDCPRLDSCRNVSTVDFDIGTWCEAGDCDDIGPNSSTPPVVSSTPPSSTWVWSYPNPNCRIHEPCCSVQLSAGRHSTSSYGKPRIVCAVFDDELDEHGLPVHPDGVPCSDEDMGACYTLICSPCDQYPEFDQATVCE